VPESIMPSYAFLADNDLKAPDIAAELSTLSHVGVPYAKDDIAKAGDDLRTQAGMGGDAADLARRYPKAQSRDYDGNPGRLTEMDALVAYLQVLGTMVNVDDAAAQEQLAKDEAQ
jgi:cytochrome c oxidase cbb3-type subunit 2